MTTKEFMKKNVELKNAGYSEGEVASFFGKTIMELRKMRNLIMRYDREEMQERAIKLKEGGMSLSEIAKELGINEPSVRLLLDTERKVLTYEEVVEDLKTLEV